MRLETQQCSLVLVVLIQQGQEEPLSSLGWEIPGTPLLVPFPTQLHLGCPRLFPWDLKQMLLLPAWLSVGYRDTSSIWHGRDARALFPGRLIPSNLRCARLLRT